MLEAALQIAQYTEGYSYEQFVEDRRTLDAVIRNLTIMGEAAKTVPEEVRASNPEVRWRAMAGLRDIVVHEYFGIKLEIVWRVVQEDVPALARQIRKILAEHS
jgi:uncharacterized protein with HEPN domain